MKSERITMPIYGLGCAGGGTLTIERALVKLPGVKRVYANPATEMVYIEYDPDITTFERFIEAIERAGFRAGAPSVR